MSLPKICTCPTVPAADCPFHHQQACGSLAAMPCSRLITQAELENVLTHEGIVEYNAIEDPCGYDNGKTELAVSVAARVLDEIARGKLLTGSCDWEENEDGWWNTDCGNAFEFTDGSPIYNEFKCCPYCGKTLTETPYSEEDDSSANKSPDAGATETKL